MVVNVRGDAWGRSRNCVKRVRYERQARERVQLPPAGFLAWPVVATNWNLETSLYHSFTTALEQGPDSSDSGSKTTCAEEKTVVKKGRPGLCL